MAQHASKAIRLIGRGLFCAYVRLSNDTPGDMNQCFQTPSQSQLCGGFTFVPQTCPNATINSQLSKELVSQQKKSAETKIQERLRIAPQFNLVSRKIPTTRNWKKTGNSIVPDSFPSFMTIDAHNKLLPLMPTLSHHTLVRTILAFPIKALNPS